MSKLNPKKVIRRYHRQLDNGPVMVTVYENKSTMVTLPFRREAWVLSPQEADALADMLFRATRFRRAYRRSKK